MKAVIKTTPGPGARLTEAPVPRPGPDDILVKVQATSICGTDVHIFSWDQWSRDRIGEKRLPQVMGHEVAGRVVEVGACVRGIRVGDFVSAETHIPCGTCIQCLAGQQHICAALSILGVDRDGSFAEYIAVPRSVCWVNDPAIPPEAACIQEPLGNALYAVLGEDHDVCGRTMAIIGDGPIGLMATAVARAAGVTTIFLVGMFPYSMELGRRMGADHLLMADRDDVDRAAYVRDHTGGFGADIVLDMAGNRRSVAEGLRMLRKGGRFSAFGIVPTPSLELDYNGGIVFKGCQVHGINGRKMFDTWFRVRNLLASGRLDVTPLVTHLFLLEEFERGFGEMLRVPREGAKVVLFPDREELDAARARRGAV